MESVSTERSLLLTSRSSRDDHGTNTSIGDDGEGTWGGGSATAVVVLSTLIAVCGSYVFGSAIGYSSPAESGIVDDLGLSVAEYSVFGSVLTIGAILGAIVSGKIADLVSRRGAMGISQLFSTAGWVTIAFSQGAWSLDIGRLMIGCGIGLISFVVPVYIAEITPRNLRGGFATVHQFMICFGSALTYFIGAVVNWRVLALIEMVPCLVQLLGLLFIPESPRWLAKVGREKEYEAALRRLRGKNADITSEAAEIKNYTEMLEQISEGTIKDLFQKIYARSLLVGVGLMVLQQFGGTNGIAFYASSIFEDAGFPSKIGTVAMAIVQIPMAVVGVLLMDRTGRKPLLMVSAAGTCVGCFLVGFSFLLEDLQRWKTVAPSLVFIGILIYNGSFGLGLAGIPWLIMSEGYLCFRYSRLT
ncbi:sugar transporter ERD6-like 5 isoform X1 [Punica granatum]|uniref:Sugar transporter ERD6-like 5 isoform X1 n=1 Tax=Punica granatum TaxID=22663 RepID=A0A6P8E3A4_PUNGR|nr:sugar transporter ERD6-like 5 isoform X1 [Punica granatum]